MPKISDSKIAVNFVTAFPKCSSATAVAHCTFITIAANLSPAQNVAALVFAAMCRATGSTLIYI